MRWRGSRRLRFAGTIMGEETEDGGWGSTCTSYVMEEAVELYFTAFPSTFVPSK